MSTISPPSRFLRLRLPLILLVVVVAVLWGGHHWVIVTAQSKLNERLAERGLILKSKKESWSLWRGIRLEETALCRLSEKQEPLIEISSLHVDVLWGEAWSAGSAITHWEAEDATLILTDAEGAVALEHFTADFILRSGQLDIARLNASHGPVTLALLGQIFTATADNVETTNKDPLELNLEPLRAVLNTLRFTPGSAPFHISGDFAIDLKNKPVTWNTNLRGEGQKVEWRGLPMREALVEGQISQTGLNLVCDLKLLTGAAKLNLTRQGWGQTPLEMKGTLSDSAARTDEFEANYQGRTDTLTISKLSGPADLIELGRTFPPLAEEIPAELTVKTFPDIAVRDLVWHSGEQPPTWSLADLQLRTPAAIVVDIRDQPLTIDDITGGLATERGVWHFHEVKGQLLSGRFTLDADYDGTTLSKAKVTLQTLRLARLSPWVGKVSASLDDSDLSFTYNGTICRQPVRSTGSGTLVLTHAPVVHIPLLEQTYSLFPNLLPDKGKDGTGEFQVAFAMTKGIATIDPLKARSEAVTVTANGTVDLVKGRVEGEARANLRGLVGVATAPLSHVLTDMEISGPMDDIRVSPKGPIGGTRKLLSGTAKVATGSVKMSSSILKEGLTLPFEALGLFGQDKAKSKK